MAYAAARNSPVPQKPRRWSRAAGALLLLGACASSPARADGTGALLAIPGSTTGTPQILLVLDTGATMKLPGEQLRPWEPAVAWPGCYRGDRLYLAAHGAWPGCDSPRHLGRDDHYCAAAGPALAAFGRYDDALLTWNQERQRWEAPADELGAPLECRADRGRHGRGDGRLWAAQGAQGPWTDSAAAEPGWGVVYTLYDGNWLNWRQSRATEIRTPLAVAGEAAGALLAGVAGVDVGLLHAGPDGSTVVHLPAPLEQARPGLEAALAALGDDSDARPVAELLSDAARYLGTVEDCRTSHIVLFSDAPPPVPLPATGTAALHQVRSADAEPAGAYSATDIGQVVAQFWLPAPAAGGASSFAAAALPLDPAGGSGHSGEVYLGLFEPTGTLRWPGNLKKYRLHDGQLVGQDGQPVLDPVSGAFDDRAFSYWSTRPDGAQVRAGGAASRLPEPGLRRLYTNVAGPRLWTADNAVQADNPRLAAAMPGLTEAQRAEILIWARGGIAGAEFGDPLHSRPVVLDYAAPDAPDQSLVFVATNAGYLHAIDTHSGVERWAFIPARLLQRLAELRLDPPAFGRGYGLDGDLRIVVASGDGARETSQGGRSILLFGMGRGGNALFALDVTQPDAPELLWEIDPESPGFAALGQTTSVPVPATIATTAGARDIVIVGGGHDESQEAAGLQAAARGNALYLVDLLSGELVTSAGAAAGHALQLPQMRYALPAAPRVLDLDQDGYADRIYVGDTGGQLWRFDIRPEPSAAGLLDGGLLASLGGAAPDAAPEDNRRFYATPDVVFTWEDRRPVLQIHIGSGHRSRPLDDHVQDAFFAIRDRTPPGDMGRHQALHVGDLSAISDPVAAELPLREAGWWLGLLAAPGEKVLHESTTLRGRIFFATHAPAVGSCGIVRGTNRLYEVSLTDGRAMARTESPAGPQAFRELLQKGLGTEPLLLFTSAGERAAPAQICVGFECLQVDPSLTAPQRSFWHPGDPR